VSSLERLAFMATCRIMLTCPCRFSAYFQVAHAYLFGSQQGVKAYTRLDDKDIHALSDKITCVVDDNDKALLGMGSRVVVKYTDGTVEDKAMPFPLGEPEHPVSIPPSASMPFPASSVVMPIRLPVSR
jgi:2-methylcitrate dehydratase PrpD